MKYCVSRLTVAMLLITLSVVLSAVAAQCAVVVYLDEYGACYGYQNPDAYDATSALNALASPPKPDLVGGKVLSSGVLPGSKVLSIGTVGDTTTVDFSSEIIGTGLQEARMSAIFDQVKGTLYQFGFTGNISVLAAGQPLSSYVKQPKRVGPGPEALRDLQLRADNPIVGMVGLAGRKITVSPGHGWYWNGSGWYTQRPVYCSPLSQEDFHTLEISKYLETYLAQDGATVKMVRCTNMSYGNSPWPGSHPWWQMGATYWLAQMGYPCTVYGPDGCNLGSGASDSANDILSRPLASDYDASDIYVSVHTNGLAGDCYGGCASGTCTYYDAGVDHSAYGAVSQSLANCIQNSLMDAIKYKYPDGSWYNRGALNSNGAYGEIRVPSRAATLTELAFHDTCDNDAVKLRDNFFRSTAMWAMYKGICDYFGVTPGWDYYSCEVISHDIPTAMLANEVRTVHVTLRNRGVLWNDVRGFHLGAVGDSDPFSATTRQPISGEVGPNTTCTFTFNLKAPNAIGTFTTHWRMVRDGFTWFGPTVSQDIVVTGLPDNEPPSMPANVTGVSPAPNRVNLSWTASTDNIGVVGYNIYRDNVKITSTAATSYSDTPLSAATTYTYEITAYDLVGNESARSTPPTIVTTQAGDTTPPTVPTNLVATGYSMTEIDLTWTASTDNMAVTGYKVYKNGSYLTSVTGTSYADTGLSQNQTNAYAVSAYDAAGNESAQSTPSAASTWALVYQFGFPDLTGWVADQVADGSIRGGIYDSSKNHATYIGDGSITTAAGSADGNGCLSYHDLGAGFTSGRLDAWFWDGTGTAASRQGVWLRCYNGASLAGWTYLGTYSTTNIRQYHASAGNSWAWASNIAGRVSGWRNFRTDVMPSGAGAVKFYIDGALKATKERFSALDDYGISRISIGYSNNVYLQAWYDDIQFSAPVPNAPAIGMPSLVTVSSIRWNFTDKADSESGFVLQDGGDAQKGTAGRNASYIDESGIPANTLCMRHVRAKNGTIEGPASTDMSKCTLSIPPSISTVICDKPTSASQSNPDFTFTAVGGFGAGKVQYYKHQWDQSATHTWAGSEYLWDGGGVVQTLNLTASSAGSWYLHLKGYNSEGIENGTLDLGPFNYDGTDSTPPNPPTAVTDEGAYTPSTSELSANWSGASDPQSGIAKYQYAIGINAGGNDIVDWTDVTGTSVTKTGLTLSAGNTYYISVKAQNGAGLWSTTATSSDGIKVVADTGTIKDAKALDNAGDKEVALLHKALTANFGDCIYIQETNPVGVDHYFGAIKVAKDGVSFAQGTYVDVAGIIGLASNGERVILGPTVKASTGSDFPRALLFLSRDLGGEPLNVYTPGISGMAGANNLGLLVQVCGKLTKAESGYWTVTDGAPAQYQMEKTSTYVDVSQLSSAKKAELLDNDIVIMTGICIPDTVDGLNVPIVKLRTDADVVYYR